VHKALAAVADQTVGIELYGDGVSYLRSKGYDVRLADACSLEFNEKFDVIVAGDVIEHLDNAGGFLSSCHRHLLPGGVLLITTDSPWFWKHIVRAALFGRVKNNLEHVSWIDPVLLRQLASRFGFSMDEKEVVYGAREMWLRCLPLPAPIKFPTYHAVLRPALERGGRDVQLQLGVFGEELRDLLSLVAGEIVGDHVDLFTSWLVGHDVGEERDDLGRGVPCGVLAQHFAALGIAGVKRGRPVSVVLETMALETPRRERQDWIRAIERLDVRLLINAKHRGMSRWVEIKTDNIRGLLLEVRIVRGHVALDPMGLQSMLTPHPRHHHMAHAQLLPELARAPLRQPTGRCPARRLQNPRLKLRRQSDSSGRPGQNPLMPVS
jgi:SAM-dependent methyltransferase